MSVFEAHISVYKQFIKVSESVVNDMIEMSKTVLIIDLFLDCGLCLVNKNFIQL